MKGLFFLLVSVATLVAAGPTNDWNKPCFHGECAYDLTEASGGYGSVKIFGEPKAITDITPAAGWVILDCDPHALAQDIRLVCQSQDATSAGCSHMFDHGGPIDKIVRLPESCGAGPFMRIASIRIAQDQSIPAHVEGKISRRDGVAPPVHILSVDGNFAAVDPARTGVVNFAIVASNIPGLDFSVPVDESLQTRSADGIFDWFKKAVNAVKNAAVKVWNGIKQLPSTLQKLTQVKFKASKDIVLKKDGEKTLIDEHTRCGSVDAHLTVKIAGHIDMKATVGVAADGSVIPPTVSSFGAFVALNGDVDAHLTVNAALHATFESKRIQFINFPLTPITVPLIFTLGPWLQVDGYAKAQLDLEVDIDVSIGYHIENLEYWYPSKPEKEAQSKIVSKESPIKLSAEANVQAHGSIEGHLVAGVHLGFSAIGGAVGLSAFVEADGFAALELNAEAHLSASNRRALDASPAVPQIADRAYVPSYPSHARDLAIRDFSASFTGCIDLNLGIILRGGAEGHLFSLKGEVTREFFKPKPLNIFHKCWQAGTPKKRDVSVWQPSELERRSQALLKCGSGKKASLGQDKGKAQRFK